MCGAPLTTVNFTLTGRHGLAGDTVAIPINPRLLAETEVGPPIVKTAVCVSVCVDRRALRPLRLILTILVLFESPGFTGIPEKTS